MFPIPNYVAHELFGARVKEQLPESLYLAADAEPLAFRCGLFGPDPLIFLPGGIHLSRELHANWREMSAPKMQEFLQEGKMAQQSFAAGYLCHQILDDAAHALIYALMREQGLSHHILEIGLDLHILRELGKERFPKSAVPQKKKLGKLAAEVLAPVKALEYSAGLSSMSLICTQMNKVGRLYQKKLLGDYRAPICDLYDILGNTVQEAVYLIEDMSEGRRWNGAVLQAT